MFKKNDLQPSNRKHKSDLEKNIVLTGGNIAPIIVDKDMVIKDGHGRLLACMNNNLPVRYVITEHEDSMTLLNTSSTQWTINEYIAYNAKIDNNYKKLLEKIDTKIPLGVLVSVYRLSPSYFRDGNDISMIDFDYIDYIWEKCKIIMDITGSKTKNGVHRAIGKMLKFDTFDIDILIFKIKSHWGKKYEYGVVDGDNAIFYALSEMYDYSSRDKLNMYYAYKSKGE
jgi:hypothetical protein